MMTTATCPPTEQLRAMSLGRLTEEESDDLLNHIRDCETCRDELALHADAEDTLVGQLRDDTNDNSFAFERGCRAAVTKALAALALAQADDADPLVDVLPEIIGEYQIVRPIGRGGMSSVYLARHTKLDREVAVKVLSSRRLAEQHLRERFTAEMRIVGALSHPNIVTAYDARDIDGLAVLVMEFIDGLDAGEIVRRVGPLSVADACAIGMQVTKAIEYISQRNLVHRDIKPSNVMVDRNGNVKLLDLGLARLQDPNADAGELTATGQAMGTADYIPPEQVNDSRTVDFRADIYALGCTLFKLLSGRAPFGDTHHVTAIAKLNAHVSTPAPSLAEIASHVPNDVVELVDRMLEKDPARRPQDPRQIADELEQHLAGADLKQLLERACEARRPSKPDQVAGPATSPRPQLVVPRRRVPVSVMIGCFLLGTTLGFLAGISVTIKKPDGTVAAIEAPHQSRLTIDEEGNVEVRVGDRSDTDRAVLETPAEGAASVNRKFDGKDLREWLSELTVERNPERLAVAVRALGFLADENSNHVVAEAVFRLMRELGSMIITNDPQGRLITESSRTLWKMPPGVVVASMLSEIEKGNLKSRQFMIWMLHPQFLAESADTEALKRGLHSEMKRRADEMTSLLLHISRDQLVDTRNWAIEFLVMFCNAMKLDPAEVAGLIPRMQQELPSQNTAMTLAIADVLVTRHPETPGLVESLTYALVEKSRVYPAGLGDLNVVIDYLRKLGPQAAPAVPLLVKQLRELMNHREYSGHYSGLGERFDLRAEIVETLGEIGPKANEAVLLLQEITQDPPDAELREKAARAIEKISIADQSAAALPAVSPFLSDEQMLSWIPWQLT